MVLPGECIESTQTVCAECGRELPIKVCRSVAGFYIGFFCPHCGPYSRESGYFPSHEDAEQALNSGKYGR